MNASDATDLPHLAEVFDLLRKGRHVCEEDHRIYFALRQRFEDFRHLFDALGFELVRHERKFFYFRGTGELGTGASQMVVFFLVLIEALGDDGRDVHAAIFDEEHRVADLPHLRQERHRRLCAEVGIHGEDELDTQLQRMERYGFAEVNGDSFRFRAPVWRFVELCYEAADALDEASDQEGA
ncbi:hypothetical protein FIV42_15595 [Persicimonas caeni]|uniref:DUF4194 domain-containing protein n=1 Tax=Persicimonas caeni TaxID=2292766 RepID=A0A4Y6PWJ6_PERCE|nr:hypothetical protein [Persicimonas caeni]QDG52115.1 hypothetical protein FIV42_15595 [Persicimonas caeni]QED33336.1 hypothetical protein FRD00_15590 [Persicimonas caeni]